MQNRLPSQPYPNPRENVSTITLRSGKELKEPRKSRELELELEVKETEPELDTDSDLTTKEIGEKKREPLSQFHPFLVNFEALPLR